MTRPAPAPRVFLIGDRTVQISGARPAPIRRYRLARLRFDGRATEPGARFEHLKRTFD